MAWFRRLDRGGDIFAVSCFGLLLPGRQIFLRDRDSVEKNIPLDPCLLLLIGTGVYAVLTPCGGSTSGTATGLEYRLQPPEPEAGAAFGAGEEEGDDASRQ